MSIAHHFINSHSKIIPLFEMDLGAINSFSNEMSISTTTMDVFPHQDRDAQKLQWISKFVDELKNDQWVLPALKQIKEICTLFPEVKNELLFFC